MKKFFEGGETFVLTSYRIKAAPHRRGRWSQRKACKDDLRGCLLFIRCGQRANGH